MSKTIRYVIGIVTTGLIVYHSVYFMPLDERQTENEEVLFDVHTLVEELWERELVNAYDSAVEITSLLDRLKTDPEPAFQQHAQALGIGNIAYFKVQGRGTVRRINENNVLLEVDGQPVEVETEFIFGNAIRDASGLIKINDFDNTSDFNSISETINEKIRTEIIPEFRAKVKEGSNLTFKGAIELNQAHLDLDQLEVIPLQLVINP